MGCQYPFEFKTGNEIREEVLNSDPSFAEVLDKKTKLDEEVRILLEDFTAKKRELDNKAIMLRKELKIAKEDFNNGIKKIDSQLTPYRQKLQEDIKGLVTELKLKESSLSATRKMIAGFEKLLGQSPSSENIAKESAKWKDKIASLKVQAEELEKEVSHTSDKISLNRLKLKLLK